MFASSLRHTVFQTKGPNLNVDSATKQPGLQHGNRVSGFERQDHMLRLCLMDKRNDFTLRTRKVLKLWYNTIEW